MKYARIQDGLIFEFFTTDGEHDITYYFGDYGVWAPVNAALDPQPEQNWTAVQDEEGRWTFAAPVPPPPTDVETRWKRYTMLEATDWIVTRHRDQVASSGATSLTAQEYQAWLVYRQALRDVPAQSGFPAAVVWPSIPPGIPIYFGTTPTVETA